MSWSLADLNRALLTACVVLQSELGDVVFVELPEIGSEVEKDQTFGVLESVKVLALPAQL